MRIGFGLVAAVLLLAGCSSRNIIEERERNEVALVETQTYVVRPLKITFKPPQAWEIDDTRWSAMVASWQADYVEELRRKCYKTLRFVTEADEAKDGPAVTCEVYEMDKGGFGGFGGHGFARAHIVIQGDAKALYDAKLEGQGSNAGFEGAAVGGRMKFAVLNVARQLAAVMNNGG